MDILERAAVTNFGAKWLTLDTSALLQEVSAEGEIIELPDTIGRSIPWYQRRGYKSYRVSLVLNLHIGETAILIRNAWGRDIGKSTEILVSNQGRS